jgi:hypothetical protein
VWKGFASTTFEPALISKTGELFQYTTDPMMDRERWLLHHGYTPAKGVANLDQAPEAPLSKSDKGPFSGT